MKTAQQRVSDRINNMAESQTLAMTRLARELKAQGKDVISLSIGEPDFNTPEFIKEAAKKAIDDNYSHYTPVPGLPEVLESISNKFKRDNGLDYPASQIIISTGAKHSIANLCLSLLNEGDEVLVPAPFWVSYYEIIRLAGGVPVVIPASIDTDFKVTPEQLQAHITPKTRMMLFSSPCNPSGSVYTETELKSIANLLGAYPEIIIASDEIYEHINFLGKHTSIGTFHQVKDQTVTINGVSKGFAMTGWRVGFMGGPKWIIDACIKMQGQFTSGTNAIAQKATQAAMEADPDVTADMREAFKQRRDLLLSWLQVNDRMKLNVPEGAFYLFPDVSAYFGGSVNGRIINDATALSMYLLEEAHVAVVTGEAFGNPNCIRISYAASEETLKEAADRIADALKKIV